MESVREIGGEVLVLVVVVLAALLAHWLFFLIAGLWARRSKMQMDDSLVRHSKAPTALLVVLLAMRFWRPDLQFEGVGAGMLQRLWAILFVGSVAWLVLRGTRILQDMVDRRYDVTQRDNLLARQIHTQVRVVRRIISVVTVVVAGALMLMSFPAARTVGASLLASAGIAGLAVGLSARPVLENLLAGVQIALAQPIRLDDVVIVQGEWGRVEEITTTFVVVRIWDQRCLVVPIRYFIENPVQNWTRQSSDLLGTVVLYVDYTAPVDAIRDEVKRIAEASGLWDGKACGLQVTDANSNTLQIRVLVSAEDSGKAWDLRCLMREKLVDYLKKEHPGALPRTRVEVEGGNLPA